MKEFFMGGKYKWLCFVVISIVTCCNFVVSGATASDLEGKSGIQTKVAAHRGGKALFPENTLFAYQQTASLWKNCLLEGDIQLTADGVAVLMHDSDVERTTNGQGQVSKKTLKEIKMLDAGFNFTTDGGQTYPYRGKGITVPTLDEVLEAFPTHTFLFEVKPFVDNIKPIVEPILKRNMTNNVYLASIYPMIIQKIRSEAPQIKTCFTTYDAEEFLRVLRNNKWEEYKPPAMMLAINEKMEDYFKITNDDMKKMKEKGIQILVFTVNNPESIKKYLQSEVNWILSDHPDRVAQLEKELSGS